MSSARPLHLSQTFTSQSLAVLSPFTRPIGWTAFPGRGTAVFGLRILTAELTLTRFPPPPSLGFVIWGFIPT